MELNTNNSSVFKLKYRLVLKIKDVSWIDKEFFINRVSEMFSDISNKYGITKDMLELKDGALFIKFSAKPNTEISKFINAYKSATSKKIKKDFDKANVVNEFWSKGYLLLTLGDDNEELIQKYI